MSSSNKMGVVTSPGREPHLPPFTWTVENAGNTTLQVGDLVAFDSDEATASGFDAESRSSVFSYVKRTTAATDGSFYHAVVVDAPSGGAATGDSLRVVTYGIVKMRVGTVQSSPVEIGDGDALFAQLNQVFASEDGAQLASGQVQVATYRDAAFTPSAQLASEIKTVFFDGFGESFGRNTSS